MKLKIIKRIKKILNTGVDSQQLIVIILFGGFAFLIQATISREQNLVFGYLLYVGIASFFFMFMNWKERKK